MIDLAYRLRQDQDKKKAAKAAFFCWVQLNQAASAGSAIPPTTWLKPPST
jgi:hypothetical protein